MSSKVLRFTRSRVPTMHLLRAALQAGQLLDQGGTSIPAARASYPRVPTGGLFHPDDLIVGEKLLVEAGVVQRSAGWLYPSGGLDSLLGLEEQEACELLLVLTLKRRRPLWSQVAVREDRVLFELIPDEEADLLFSVIPEPSRREALLLALARTQDSAANEELGARGEEAVVTAARSQLQRAGRPDLADRVQRVSLLSDQLGYDVVAPTLEGKSRRIEVKTAGTAGDVMRIFLSRNEAEVGRRDSNWYLVVCQLTFEGAIEVVGWSRGRELEEVLPSDTTPSARWESARLMISIDTLTPDLPPIL